jgi:hypothetical protein
MTKSGTQSKPTSTNSKKSTLSKEGFLLKESLKHRRYKIIQPTKSSLRSNWTKAYERLFNKGKTPQRGITLKPYTEK